MWILYNFCEFLSCYIILGAQNDYSSQQSYQKNPFKYCVEQKGRTGINRKHSGTSFGWC